MITVFTGTPGAGKTAALVDMLSKMGGDRPLFVDGLDGLTLPHTVVDANDWHNQLPDGAILVIDEVQRVWRPRGPGSKVPQSVAELETHRHRGIDVFVTTQSPRLLDSNVRALVGRHVHIRDVGVLGRHWYEWPEINDAMQWKGCVNRHRFTLPKKAFALYKSSSLHTVPVRGFPRVLIIGVFALLAFLVLGYGVYRIMQKVKSGNMVGSPEVVAPAGEPVQNGMVRSPGREVVAYDVTQFIPRVSNRPESAPAFDHLRVVTVMRRLSIGFCVGSVCECRDNQGIVLDIPYAACKQFIDKGRFDPYRVDSTVAQVDNRTQSTNKEPSIAKQVPL